MPGGKAQYNQVTGGNAAMKPETSTNATLGFRLEPSNSFGIGADLWEVKLEDVVSAVSADQAFADPVKYADLFTLSKTPAQPQLYWTFKSMSTNIAKAIYRGIDWDIVTRVNTGIGRVTAGLTGTYMIRSSYTKAGTDNIFVDSMGKYGENAAVTFRNVITASVKLDKGAFSNSLILKARSGYKDKAATVRDVLTNKNTTVAVDVPRYATLNWQGTYKHSKAMEFRAGVNNLFNAAPPFTLRDSSGHQVGYDPRYADPKMRTVYVSGTYNF
jgi:iron complex outermembrane receptor protein